MQIKNILFAAFFVATSQLSCVDEQTDIKAKLCAELDAKYEILSNLSKKITEQEIACEIVKFKIIESFKKYETWQRAELTEKKISNSTYEEELSILKQRFAQNINEFQQALYAAIAGTNQMQNLVLDCKYKKDCEDDCELFTFYAIKCAFETTILKNLIFKWKICANEIAVLERQLQNAQ